MTKHIITNCSQ